MINLRKLMFNQRVFVRGGRAAGEVRILQHFRSDIIREPEGKSEAEEELSHLQTAVKLTDERLIQYENQVRTEKGGKLAQIFRDDKILLTDPVVIFR